MTKTELIKEKMIEALKAHDKETKESLSMLIQALQKAAKEKREELVKDLHKRNDLWLKPVSWMHFKDTEECKKKEMTE